MAQLLQETLAAISDNAWICHFVTEMCRQLNGYNGFPAEKVRDVGPAVGSVLGEGCWEGIQTAGGELGSVSAFENGILPISSACGRFCPTVCQELVQGQSVSPDVCPAVPLLSPLSSWPRWRLWSPMLFLSFQNFLYKCIGTTLGACVSKELVQKQLQELLETARYNEEAEWEVRWAGGFRLYPLLEGDLGSCYVPRLGLTWPHGAVGLPGALGQQLAKKDLQGLVGQWLTSGWPVVDQ